MKPHWNPRVTGWMLGALVLLFAEAHADGGFTVTTSRENAIALGMSMSEVQQQLGRPERAARYGNTPGPVWTYRVVAPLFGKTEFNVEFGADGKVIAKSEYVIGSDAPNGGRD